jgi:hypothetical protein
MMGAQAHAIVRIAIAMRRHLGLLRCLMPLNLLRVLGCAKYLASAPSLNI